jgi:imidazolonepropionase-like amidohydrolase
VLQHVHGRRPIATVTCTLLLLGALSVLGPGAPAAGADLTIRNARLYDGTGAPPRAGVSIRIRDGRIVEIRGGGAAAPSDGSPTLDAAGATVLPGLIDAHVHLEMVPGAAHRSDTADIKRDLRRHHLRAYLARGVTTVLDTGIRLEVLDELRGWLASGEPGPRVLALGPPISAPGGYSSTIPASYAFGTSVSTQEEVFALVARIAAAQPAGLKVKIEEGLGPFAVWPLHPPEIRAAIVEAASLHGLPIYVHGSSEKEQRIALEMGAHALVHGGFWDAEPTPEFVRALREAGTYVITTICAVEAARIGWQPETLDDPFYRDVVPAVELETARDPGAARGLDLEMAELSLPWWMPRFLHGLLIDLFLTRELRERTIAYAKTAIRRFHDAGVPLVLGSDSGNWEIIPYEFHGPTTVRELELLLGAGLSAEDALAAATYVPARMLGIEDEVGTVEVGKRADLVIVAGDPLKDPTTLRIPRWVVRNGVARTPEEWMGRQGSPALAPGER